MNKIALPVMVLPAAKEEVIIDANRNYVSLHKIAEALNQPVNVNAKIAEQLTEAADMIEEWGSYASAYFREKHNLSGDVLKIRNYAIEALNQPKKCKWQTKTQSLLDESALTGCEINTKLFSSQFEYCPYCGGVIEL